MSPIIFNMGWDAHRMEHFLKAVSANVGSYDYRQFPDGESYLNVLSDVNGQRCIILADGFQPDSQFLRWIFMAENLKELGAQEVGLLIPYLPYMRQDIRFKPGECVTSRHFAKLISQSFDWLATTDPHLHRYHSLSEIYTIPTQIVPAAPVIADWISVHIDRPVIVGPDVESQQWVADVAEMVGCPYEVLLKKRMGDRDVHVSLPESSELAGNTPVLVDDIISTGRTMAQAVKSLISCGLDAPVCIGVHPLFSDDCISLLNEAGAAQVVSCNTIDHPSARIDLTSAWGQAIDQYRTE